MTQAPLPHARRIRMQAARRALNEAAAQVSEAREQLRLAESALREAVAGASAAGVPPEEISAAANTQVSGTGRQLYGNPAVAADGTVSVAEAQRILGIDYPGLRRLLNAGRFETSTTSDGFLRVHGLLDRTQRMWDA